MARNFIVIKSVYPSIPIFILPIVLFWKKGMGWSYDSTKAVRMYKWEAEMTVKGLERNGTHADIIKVEK